MYKQDKVICKTADDLFLLERACCAKRESGFFVLLRNSKKRLENHKCYDIVSL